MSAAKRMAPQEMRRIPPEEWGRDHNTTLLYLETRLVDGDGRPKFPQMRCNPSRHPHYQGDIARFVGWDDHEYSSRLANGDREMGHDDWDCLDDMEASGLVVSVGTGANPCYRLTDAGWLAVGKLRRERADRNNPRP